MAQCLTPPPQRENVEGAGFFYGMLENDGWGNADPEGPCPHGPEPAMEIFHLLGPSGDGPSGHARVRPSRDSFTT